MRALSIFLAVVVLALVGMTLTPGGPAYQPNLTYGMIAVAVAIIGLQLAGPAPKSEPKRPVATAAQPAPPPPVAHLAEAEVISFLATLQEKGRLVDFLMEDITAYNDQQVAAAARVVHDGCRSALKEHIGIRPVREENEGSAITIAAGYAADEYRLVGKIAGEPPFSGTLVHRGWRTESVKLPRVLRPQGDRLPTIAPAEVELK